MSQQQKENAKSLGVVFREDLDKIGYLTKDNFRELFNQEQTEYQKQQEGIKRVLGQAENLESEINGSDGRPKFRKDLVMAYAAAYQIGDLNEAYEKMYPEEINAWKTAQVEAAKRPSLKTLRGGGAKNPQEIKVTRDNASALMSEALWGGSE